MNHIAVPNRTTFSNYLQLNLEQQQCDRHILQDFQRKTKDEPSLGLELLGVEFIESCLPLLLENFDFRRCRYLKLGMSRCGLDGILEERLFSLFPCNLHFMKVPLGKIRQKSSLYPYNCRQLLHFVDSSKHMRQFSFYFLFAFLFFL